MTPEVTTKTLWDSRRGFLGWGIGIAAATAVYTSSYALIDAEAYEEVIASFPEGIIEAMGFEDIASPAGYLGSTVYGLVVAVLVTIFAIGLAARYLAGDEETGRLELTMSHPVSRVSIVLQRALALAAACLVAGLVVFLAVIALREPVGLDVPIGRIFLASMLLGLLALVFGTLTLALGGIIGRRGVVLGVASAVAVFAYFGNTIIPSVDGFEWVQNLSFFHFADAAAALEFGLDGTNLAIAIGLVVAFTAIAVFAFDRRDIGTG